MVLLLSTRPCCADDCSNVSTITQDSSQTNDKDCASCSPFACYCVGFIISKPITYTLTTIPVKHIKHTNVFHQLYIEDVAQAIWQPPKLS
jgi:hypothetical protein